MGNWLGDFDFKWALFAVLVSFILMTVLVLLVLIWSLCISASPQPLEYIFNF